MTLHYICWVLSAVLFSCALCSVKCHLVTGYAKCKLYLKELFTGVQKGYNKMLNDVKIVWCRFYYEFSTWPRFAKKLSGFQTNLSGGTACNLSTVCPIPCF